MEDYPAWSWLELMLGKYWYDQRSGGERGRGGVRPVGVSCSMRRVVCGVKVFKVELQRGSMSVRAKAERLYPSDVSDLGPLLLLFPDLVSVALTL